MRLGSKSPVQRHHIPAHLNAWDKLLHVVDIFDDRSLTHAHEIEHWQRFGAPLRRGPSHPLWDQQ
jgi:hypothetical protein